MVCSNRNNEMRRILAVLSAIILSTVGCHLELAQDGDDNSMSFFITSENIGRGGELGGLTGADAHCQSLADAAGAGNRSWRAYLSTSTVNARDRIGQGPWYNVKGELIARDLTDLHDNNDNIMRDNSYDESGGRIPGIDDEGTMHDMLTGTQADGTVAFFDGSPGIEEQRAGDPATCRDWSGGGGRARVGHFDSQRGNPGTLWNSAHFSRGCSQEEIEMNDGRGLFYCFASD